MAPLSFNDNIELYSLIGTWLGALFTLFGLLAVLQQLRSFFKGFSEDRRGKIRDEVGEYEICLPDIRSSDLGLLEGKAPSIAAWVSHHYVHNLNTVICPYNRQITGGQASWSKLFSRLQILPQHLLEIGKRIPSPNEGGVWQGIPAQCDFLIEGGKILYGMTGAEFAAILIIGGFSPSRFYLGDHTTSAVVKHHMRLGQIYFGYRDAFSQIAQFDGASNVLTDQQATGKTGRFSHSVGVRRCIDLALGLFRFTYRGEQTVVILGTDSHVELQEDDAYSPIMEYFRKPSSKKLVTVRKRLTSITNAVMMLDEPMYDIMTTAAFDFHRLVEDCCWKTPFPTFDTVDRSDLEIGLRLAVVLTDLRPWGTPPVMHSNIKWALVPILSAVKRKLAVGSLHQSTTHLLIRKLQEIPLNSVFEIPGWTKVSMEKALYSIKDIEAHNFSGLTSKAALYYDAMNFAFSNKKVNMESLQIRLAARCAAEFLHSRRSVWAPHLEDALAERLNGSPLKETEPWALEILVTYLIAWLNFSVDIDDNFRVNFRRRVFLR